MRDLSQEEEEGRIRSLGPNSRNEGVKAVPSMRGKVVGIVVTGLENRVMKFLHCTNEKRRASPGNEKISLDARNERRGEVEGSRSVKLLELPSAWKLSTPSVGKRTKMQRSSSPTLIPHPPSRLLALSPPLSCDAVESIYRDSPLLPRQLLVLFSPTTLCIEEGGGTLSGSSSPTAESLGLGSEKEDLIKAERNEPGKTTGVHLSRSRRSGLLFLRSFFYLAISPVSTVSPNNRPVPNRLPAPTASSISTLISSDRYISKAETLSWNGMTPYTYTKRRTLRDRSYPPSCSLARGIP